MRKTLNSIFKLLCLIIILVSCQGEAGNIGPNNGVGKGGSTAKFTIVSNYLYVVDGQSLKTFDIKGLPKTELVNTLNLSTAVETIFPLDNKLFLGTQTGMYIYDISTPNSPKNLSIYSHVVSCDPVVADGKYAYVTLRSGTNCNRGVNLLDIIDISDIKSPKIIKSYPMLSPHGLGIAGKLLFITEGNNGLKIYDRTDPNNIILLKNIPEMNAFDVIPNQNTLLVTGALGIKQYDYSDINNISEISSIAIGK